MANQNDASNNVSVPPAVLPHHPVWYSENVTIFQIEGTLFRVPSRKLAESSAQFREMVSRQDEGHSDDRPVVLDDKQMDFCALLKFFDPLKDGPLTTLDEWLGVSRLSQKYGFAHIPDLDKALDELANRADISTCQLYELGRTHNVQRWKDMAIIRFCNAKFALSATDARQIGFPLAFAIGVVREHLLVSHIPFERNLSSLPSSDQQNLLKMVRGVEGGRNIMDGCSPKPKTTPFIHVGPAATRISSGTIPPSNPSSSMASTTPAGSSRNRVAQRGMPPTVRSTLARKSSTPLKTATQFPDSSPSASKKRKVESVASYNDLSD